MNLSIDKDRTFLIEKCYLDVTFRSDDGETFAICNRDTGFEFKYNGAVKMNGDAL